MIGGEFDLSIGSMIAFAGLILGLAIIDVGLPLLLASMVLKYINQVRAKGLGVIFITHNVRHASGVGQRFTVLNRGKTLGTFSRSEITLDELRSLMAGGKELQELSGELEGTS